MFPSSCPASAERMCWLSGELVTTFGYPAKTDCARIPAVLVLPTHKLGRPLLPKYHHPVHHLVPPGRLEPRPHRPPRDRPHLPQLAQRHVALTVPYSSPLQRIIGSPAQLPHGLARHRIAP